MKDEQKVYIRGVENRGKEVIEALKKLGGINRQSLGGGNKYVYYYINPKGAIDYGYVDECSPEHLLVKEFYKEIKLPEKGNLRWKPIEGEKYYYINDIGIIDASYWRNNISDKYHYNIGNCFKYGDGRIRTILKMLGNVFANKKEDD